MINNNKMSLFRKTDTTLVYIASNEFSKEIIGKYCKCDLYIHVGRDKGNVVIYENNDINKVVYLELKIQQYILKCAAADR